VEFVLGLRLRVHHEGRARAGEGVPERAHGRSVAPVTVALTTPGRGLPAPRACGLPALFYVERLPRVGIFAHGCKLNIIHVVPCGSWNSLRMGQVQFRAKGGAENYADALLRRRITGQDFGAAMMT
jgi:hypothetical protein